MRVLWAAILPLLLFFSCDMMPRVKDQFFPLSEHDDVRNVSVSALHDDQTIFNENEQREIPAVEVPTIILTKGNSIVHGLPCFDENAIRAIKGEYKLEMPDDLAIKLDDSSPFFIESWLTSEFIYASPELWRERNPLRNLRAMEMQNDESVYIVSSFPAALSGQEKWTILFHVPQKMMEEGMSNALIDRMIQSWTSRLSYYISNSQDEYQISLPAVVEF